MEHPIFLSAVFQISQLLLPPPHRAPGASPRSEVADTRADVPGGRVRRVVRQDTRAIHTTKGGIHMAKKAAKGAKKKAAKKK